MNFTSFLIKYAEIGIKGKNRYVFEDALVAQIKIALRRVEGKFDVYRNVGRIYVDAKSAFDYDEVVTELKTVFGIVGICPVMYFEDEGFEKLQADIVDYMDQVYPDKHKTFKVFARRARKNYPVESPEICIRVGEAILNAFPDFKVDVHKPEISLQVEIREKICVYSEIIPGPGGLPLGTNGKGMLLLSGGIDSPVAGYMVAKRGVCIDATYFHAPPYTSERAKQKVVDLAKLISRYTGPIQLHVINFTDVQLHIYEKCPHDELTIIMRRYMMRIAEEIARKNDCLGLITGESIGQVASQTMHALACTDDATTMAVYRPLIGFDKNDIIDISEKIGTFETSILPFEDCCTIFVAKHPVTKPNLGIITEHEKDMIALGEIEALVRTAVESEEIISVSWEA